jgi:hypothetical protein
MDPRLKRSYCRKRYRFRNRSLNRYRLYKTLLREQDQVRNSKLHRKRGQN